MVESFGESSQPTLLTGASTLGSFFSCTANSSKVLSTGFDAEAHHLWLVSSPQLFTR